MAISAPSIIERPLCERERQAFSWTQCVPVKTVMAALDHYEENSARFVGGCVRDSLLGMVPDDIDVATTLPPEETRKALMAADIKVVDTGIEHGTLTAVCQKVPIEITSLRRDVSTDGRRASVAFTRNWQEDAHRRDFTINALYLSPEGQLFDYGGGLDDLANRCVRFIGNADERIREDYLRILRFFRFSARFSDQYHDEGLKAVQQEQSGFSQLSRERVGQELLKILGLQKALFAVRGMIDTGIMPLIWPHPAEHHVFETVISMTSGTVPAQLALAALWGAQADEKDMADLAERLRLSNLQTRALQSLVKASVDAATINSLREGQVLAYRYGAENAGYALTLVAARYPAHKTVLSDIQAQLQGWEPPKFGLSGKDVIQAGIDPGPAVSAVLRGVEADWLAGAFPDRQALYPLLQKKVAEHLSATS